MYKRYILLLLTLFIFAVSCDDDDWFYEDYLVSHSWAVDLFENSGEPLFSVFYFDWEQYGFEDRFFQFDDVLYDSQEFDWYWSSYDRDVLVLDYGYGYSFIRVRSMNRYVIEGYFYRDEFDFDSGRGRRVVFERVD